MIFLFDVDNTLLDNDRVIADLRQHLVARGGLGSGRTSYFGDLRGAAQRARLRGLPRGAAALPRQEHPRDPHLLTVSSFLVELPVRESALPRRAGRRRARAAASGPTVILSDGDVVFQPRKIERAGLSRPSTGTSSSTSTRSSSSTTSSAATRPSTTCSSTTSSASSPRSSRRWGERADDRLPRAGALRARARRDDVPEARRHDRTHRRAGRARRARAARRGLAPRRLAAPARSAGVRRLFLM